MKVLEHITNLYKDHGRIQLTPSFSGEIACVSQSSAGDCYYTDYTLYFENQPLYWQRKRTDFLVPTFQDSDLEEATIKSLAFHVHNIFYPTSILEEILTHIDNEGAPFASEISIWFKYMGEIVDHGFNGVVYTERVLQQRANRFVNVWMTALGKSLSSLKKDDYPLLPIHIEVLNLCVKYDRSRIYWDEFGYRVLFPNSEFPMYIVNKGNSFLISSECKTLEDRANLFMQLQA